MKNEIEICRKTFKPSKKKYFIAFLISLAAIVIAVLANVICRIIVIGKLGAEDTPRLYSGPYWPGWGVAILGIILAVVFFLMWKLNSKEMNAVLTNKRIIMSIDAKKLFFGEIHYEENIALEHIVGFDFIEYKKFKNCILVLDTAKRSYRLVSNDSEFYDKFVELIREYK